MSAIDVIESGQPFVLLFQAELGNTAKTANNKDWWLGGKSGLGHQASRASIDNGSVALSSGKVEGLSTNEVIVNDFWLEKSIGKPFESFAEYSNGGIRVTFTNDNLNLHLRDWVYKPFTIKVGYVGQDYADYELLMTGKTADHDMAGETILIALNAIPEGADNPYPTEVFESGPSIGVAKPVAHGRPQMIQPVRETDDGFWMFHNGSINLAVDDELDYAPVAHLNAEDGIAIGRVNYDIFSASNPPQSSTALNDFPSDITDAGGASIKTKTDYIQITLPNLTQYQCTVEVIADKSGNTSAVAADAIDHYFEADIVLDSTSSLEELVMIGSTYTTPIRVGKTPVTYRSETKKGISLTAWSEFHVESSTTAHGATAILNILELRVIPTRSPTGSKIRSYKTGTREQIPTFRVPDIDSPAGVQDNVVIWDSSGRARVNENIDSFSMNISGDFADVKSVAVCNQIALETNSGSTPITASFVGERVSYYANTQRRMIDHVRELIRPLDYFLDFSLSTNAITIKRRYNGLIEDFDGNANVLDSFEFKESQHIIEGSVRQGKNELSRARYTAFYRIDHTDPQYSLSESAQNESAHLNRVESVNTPLWNSDDAAQIAGLSVRDGARKVPYSLSVYGLHDVDLSSVGYIQHSRVPYKRFEVRRVKWVLLKNNAIGLQTDLDGVIYA